MLVIDLLVFTLTLYALSHFSKIFVSSTLKLSSYFRINPMVAGFFIIGLGTSIPEIFVAVSSIIQNLEMVSIADLFGATVINSTLIMGIALIIKRKVGKEIAYEGKSLTLLLTSFFIPLFLMLVKPSRYLGIASIIFYFIIAKFLLERNKSAPKPLEEKIKYSELAVEAIKLSISLFIIIFSSRFLVVSVTNLSEETGIPSTLVSAIIVSLGTATPELFTALRASSKDFRLVYANSYGSTAINLAFILGIILTFSSNVSTISFSKFTTEMFFIMLSNILVIIAFDKLDWRVGIILIGIYFLYVGISLTTYPMSFMIR